MKGKSWIGPGLGVAVLLVFLLLPPLEPLTTAGMRALGILLFTIIWWATVDIGFPSLLCSGLLIMTGVMTAGEVFAASWGNYVISFVISIFCLIECLRTSGFSRRFAYWFMTRPFIAGRPWLMIATFLLACLLWGGMGGGIACIIFMAMAEPMLAAAGIKKGDRFAATLMMGIGWVASASTLMNAFTHGGNIVFIEWIYRDFGYTLTIPTWMLIGFPIGLLVYTMILLCLRFVVRPDVSHFGGEVIEYIRGEKDKMGPMKLEEKLALGIFLSVVFFWMLPGIAGGIFPEFCSYLSEIGVAIPPILGASLLCLIRVNNQPLMTFERWMRSVPWGTVALLTAMLVLKDVISNPETGISQLFTNFFQPIVEAVPFVVIVLISIFWVGTQTQFMSNMVSMALVYTVMLPFATAAGVGNPIALGFAINALARLAIVLPSGTINTALVTGSGWVPVSFMARYGVVLVIPLILVFAFVVYPWASFILR